MADVLQSGLAWLHAQRAAHMVTTATYVPAGSGEAVSLDVTASQIRVELADANGFPVSSCVTDFLVAADDLTADPVPGDKVIFGSRTYEVLPLGEEPCWRWTDASRLTRRIHTRDIGAET